MTRWLKWLTILPIVLLLLVLVAVQLLRAGAVGEEERAALALVSVPPPAVRGVNGFPALALANHDVPDEKLDAAMALEVAHFKQWLETSAQATTSAGGSAGQPGQWADASARWPERPQLAFDSTVCSMAEADCLTKVGASREATEALLDRETVRLARVDRALAADHFRSPFPSAMEAPLPPYQLLRLSLLRAALDAVDGRVPESLSRTCTLLAASRRFSKEATDLIGRMVFSSAAEGAANLLLDVRREHPGVALPADCASALSPVDSDDYLICEAMRGEYRLVDSMTRRMDAALSESWRPVDVASRWYLFDPRLMSAWTAPRYAHACTDGFRDKVREGIVPEPDFSPIQGTRPACYGAYGSCTLARIALPDFESYQVRQLDHAAKLRLARASLALSAGSLTREQALAEAPSPGYPLKFDEATGEASLQVRAKPGRGMSREYRVAF